MRRTPVQLTQSDAGECQRFTTSITRFVWAEDDDEDQMSEPNSEDYMDNTNNSTEVFVCQRSKKIDWCLANPGVEENALSALQKVTHKIIWLQHEPRRRVIVTLEADGHTVRPLKALELGPQTAGTPDRDQCAIRVFFHMHPTKKSRCGFPQVARAYLKIPPQTLVYVVSTACSPNGLDNGHEQQVQGCGTHLKDGKSSPDVLASNLPEEDRPAVTLADTDYVDYTEVVMLREDPDGLTEKDACCTIDSLESLAQESQFICASGEIMHLTGQVKALGSRVNGVGKGADATDWTSNTTAACSNELNRCNLAAAPAGPDETSVAMATRLEAVRRELAQLSAQLDNPSGALHGANLKQSALDHCDSLLVHASAVIGGQLQSIWRDNEQTGGCLSAKALSETRAELDDILTALTSRRDGLHRLSTVVSSLISEVTAHLERIKALDDGLLQPVSSAENIDSVDEVEKRLSQFWCHLQEVPAAEDRLNDLLSRLMEFTGQVDTVLRRRFGLPGVLRGFDVLLQLEMQLRSDWNTLVIKTVPLTASRLVGVVIRIAEETCQEALRYCQDGTKLNHLELVTSPGRISDECSLVSTHLKTVIQAHAWITGIVDRLLTTDTMGCRLRSRDLITRLNQIKLISLQKARQQLDRLLRQLTMVLLPVGKAWTVHCRNAQAFLDLLHLQTRDLESTVERLSKSGGGDLLPEVTVSLAEEETTLTQLEVVRVHRKRCQQLSETVMEERSSVAEELADVLSPLFQSNAIYDDGGSGSFSLDTNSPAYERSLECIAQRLSPYDQLSADLMDCRVLLDSIIDQYSSDKVLAPDSSPGLNGENIMSYSCWDGNSGISVESPLLLSPSTKMESFFPTDKGGSHQRRESETGASNEIEALLRPEERGGGGDGAKCEEILPDQCGKDAVSTENDDVNEALGRSSVGDKFLDPIEGQLTIQPLPVSHGTSLQLTRLEDIETMLTRLQTEYREFARSILEELAAFKEQTSTGDLLQQCRHLFKDRKCTVKDYINRIPAKPTSGDVDASEEPRTEPAVKPAAISGGFNSGDLDINLTYREGCVSSAIARLEDDMNLFYSRLLVLYETFERLCSVYRRYSDWLKNFQENVAQHQFEPGDSSTTPAHINDLEILKVELSANLEPLTAFTSDSSLVCSFLELIENDLASSDLLRLLLPISTAPTSAPSSCGAGDYGDGHPDSTVNLTHLYERLASIPRGLQDECYRLFRDISDQLNAYRLCQFEAGGQLELSPDACQRMLIWGHTGSVADVFVSSGDLDGARTRLMQLQLQQIETQGLQELMSCVRHKLQGTAGGDDEAFIASVESGQRWSSEMAVQVASAEAKQKMEILKLDSLQTALFTHVVWIQRYTAKLISSGHPSGATLDRATAGFERFKEEAASFLSEEQDQFGLLTERYKAMVTDSHPVTPEKPNGGEVFAMAEDLAVTRANQPLENAYRQLGAARRQMTNTLDLIRKDWQQHCACLSDLERLVDRVQAVLRTGQFALTRVHPSKLVEKCRQQVASVEELLVQLAEHEAAVAYLCSAPLSTWFRAVTVFEPPTSIDPVQASAELHSLKHNFVCLRSRANERRRILLQALKEDQAFDTAYTDLMQVLQSRVLDSQEEEVLHDLQTFIGQQRSVYLSVLRMGSNLRDRCTHTDAERAVLESMLTNLRTRWKTCLQLLSDRRLVNEHRLLEMGELRKADQRLTSWIGLCETHLGIGRPRPPLSNGALAEDTQTSGWRREMTLGFNKLGLLALTSVFGEEALLSTLSVDHQVLVDDLKQHQQMWKLASDPVTQKANAGGEQCWSSSEERMARLGLACAVKSAALECCQVKLTELTSLRSQLSTWMDQVDLFYHTLLPLSRRDSAPSRAGNISKSSDRQEHRLLEWEVGCHGDVSVEAAQAEYDSLRQLQVQLAGECLPRFTGLLRSLTYCWDGPESGSDETRTTTTTVATPLGDISLPVRAHTRARQGLLRQYHSYVERWVQSDVHLNLCRDQLSRLCFDSPKYLALALSEAEQQATQIAQVLREQLTGLADFLDTVSREVDSGVQEAPLVTDHQLGRLEAVWQAIEKKLGDPSSPTVRLEVGLLTKLVADSEQLLTKARSLQKMVRDCAASLELSTTAVMHHHQRQSKSPTRVALRPARSQEHFLLLQSLRRAGSGSGGGGGGGSNTDPSSLESARRHQRQTSWPEPDRSQTSDVVVVVAQCKRLEKELGCLAQTSAGLVQLMERLDEVLSQHLQVHDFTFDTWRMNFCQWLKSRHLRLVLFFQATSNCPTVAMDRSFISTAEQHHASHSELSVSQDSSSQTLGPFKTATSLEHLSVALETEPHEALGEEMGTLTCDQFLQAVHRHGADFAGSSPAELRSAFRVVDVGRQGRINYKQLMEAIRPEKKMSHSVTREQLPVSVIINRAIEEETNKCTCREKFLPVKVADNKFSFGSSKRVYLVRFLNSIIMVRVGGGWLSLTEFLSKRDPCRFSRDARGRSGTTTLDQTRPEGSSSSRLMTTPTSRRATVPKTGLGSLHCQTNWSNSGDSASSLSGNTGSSSGQQTQNRKQHQNKTSTFMLSSRQPGQASDAGQPRQKATRQASGKSVSNVDHSN